MKKPLAATFLAAFLVMLSGDSAICAGGGSGANGSRYTHAKVKVPSEPGEPFLLEGKIGGIENAERQIYKQGTSPDWSQQIPKLPDLVDEALRRNPTTRQTWETANASAASLAAARGAYWPTATVNSATRPTYTRVPTFPGDARTTELDYNPTLQVQYLLFDFGGREAGVDAARFTFFASEFAINQTLQTVAVGVLKSYYTLIQVKESIDIANKSLERAQAIIDDIEETAKPAKEKAERAGQERRDVKDAAGKLESGGSAFWEVRLALNKAAEKEKEAKKEEEKKKLVVKTLNKQKQLSEPNLSSFLLSLEVARGAVAAARVQLATSVGLPGNTPMNDDTLPVSSLPRASLFSDSEEEDFVDKKLPDLIAKLTAQGDPVSKFVWEKFSPETKNTLTSQNLTEKQKRSALVEEFNRLIAGGMSIYDKQRFAGVKLSREASMLKDRRDRPILVRLNRLLLEDEYSSELRKSLSPTNAPPMEDLPAKIDDMIVEALRSRPDIANKYVSYQSTRALARQAESNIYPNLTATFTGSTTAFDKTVRNDQVSGTIETSNSGRADNFLGALTVNIPVFDALTLVNKARAARKTALASQADLANTELGAISDVATNFEAYKSAVEQYELAIILVGDATDALKAAEKSYRKALCDYQKRPPAPKDQQKAPQKPKKQKEQDPCQELTEVEKQDPCECEEPKTQEKQEACEERKKSERLQTALNTLLAAQVQLDGAATKWSLTKLSVVTSSFQLANATGALLPQYRSAANSLNPLPVRPTDRR